MKRRDLTATTAMDVPVGNTLIMNAFRVISKVSQKGLKSKRLTHTRVNSDNGLDYQATSNCSHYKNILAPISRVEDAYMIFMVLFFIVMSN